MTSRIAILTLAIGEAFKVKVKYAHMSKIEYCKKHGYDLIDDESVWDKNRPIAWSKILLICKYLPQYDYVVWLDADAMILDLDQTITSKLHLMNNRPIMVVKPWPIINTGVIFVKNDPSSLKFMYTVYAQTQFLDESIGPNWEQDAFIYVLDNNIDDLAQYVEVKSHHYEKDIQIFLRHFYPGCFILHLFGFRGDQLSWTMSKVFERVYPLQRPDETLDHYNERMLWFRTKCVEDIHNFYMVSPYAIIESDRV